MTDTERLQGFAVVANMFVAAGLIITGFLALWLLSTVLSVVLIVWMLRTDRESAGPSARRPGPGLIEHLF